MNIVISGSSKGLGLELTKKFLSAGHNVVGFSRGENTDISDPGYTHNILDISDRDAVFKAVDMLEYEKVDIIINNAGIPGSARKIAEVNPDEIQKLLNVNLFGSLNIVQAFLEKLKKGDTKRIINISSRFGSLSFNQEEENRKLRISYSYRIAKAAQNMLAVCLGNELDEYGITVDVLHPGSFQSNCGRPEATRKPDEIADTIFQWIMSGDCAGKTTMKEIGGKEYDW